MEDPREKMLREKKEGKVPTPPPAPKRAASSNVSSAAKSTSERSEPPASGEDALFAAIQARREKQEARARAIEAGEIEVEDPREKMLREKKAVKMEGASPKTPASKDSSPAPNPKKERKSLFGRK